MLRDLFSAGGAPLRVLGLLGVLGVVAALLAGIGMLPNRRGRGTFWMGTYALIFGAATMLFGAAAALTSEGARLATGTGRSLLTSEAPTPDRLRAAKLQAAGGLAAGGAPFVLGAAAIATGVKRRRRDLVDTRDDDDEPAVERDAWDSLVSGTSFTDEALPLPLRRRRGRTGVVTSVVVLVIGALALAVNVAVLASVRPPPAEVSR